MIGACLCGLLLPLVASADDTQPPLSIICIEADTGYILHEENADLPRPPASMLKLMLLLLVAEGLEDGHWALDTPIPVSERAQSMGGTQVYIKSGETYPLSQMATAIAVASANDAAFAVGEALWGSEEACRLRMNERAREIGMLDTEFHSLNGLPPDPGQPYDRTTARDMAILAQWCVRKPKVMEWTGIREFQFKQDQAIRYNTNKLLWRLPDCDGLKTGYTRAAGFCVTATAVRNGIRLIVVIMGHESNTERFKLAEQVLESGFDGLKRFIFIARGQLVEPGVPITNAARENVRLAAADDVWLTIKDSEKDKLAVVARQPAALRAPLAKGVKAGEATVQLAGRSLATVDLVVPEEVNPAGWRWKLKKSALRRIPAPKNQ